MSCAQFGSALAHIDLHGTVDLTPSIVGGVPIDNCCSACEANPACLGFVEFGGTCYLKGGDVSQYANTDRTSYLRLMPPSAPPPPPSACAPDFGPALLHVDLHGDAVGTASGPDGNCCTVCASTPACLGFVEFGGTCYLKGGTVEPRLILKKVPMRAHFMVRATSLRRTTALRPCVCARARSPRLGRAHSLSRSLPRTFSLSLARRWSRRWASRCQGAR